MHWYTGMSVEFQLERDRAYRLLLDLILGAKIDANTPLSERKLADSLQIGRTPIREAIRDLVRDGVLEARPARGTFVRELSLEDVKEIYEVRYALEGMAAFLAAERGPTAALEAYGPKFREMAADLEKFDPAEEYALGAEFHLEVFRSARNGNLLQLYEPLRIRFGVALGLPQHYDHERVRHSVSGIENPPEPAHNTLDLLQIDLISARPRFYCITRIGQMLTSESGEREPIIRLP